MPETLATCIVAFDLASLHLSFFEGALGRAMEDLDVAEIALADRLAEMVGDDVRRTIGLMQDAFVRVNAYSGAELLKQIAQCETSFSLRVLP